MSINLTQKFKFETDSIESLEKILNAAVRVLFDEKPSQYCQLYLSENMSGSFDDGMGYFSSGTKVSKPRYVHICSIGDYKNDLRTGDKKFKSYSNLIRQTIRCIKRANTKHFFDMCGDGYTDGFNEDDGTIDVGFRVHMIDRVFPVLNISLCHIYYGK